MYLFTLFSLCLGYVKARSCVNVLFQCISVFQQNDDKKAAVLTLFFFVMLVDWSFGSTDIDIVTLSDVAQLVSYTSGATLNL